MMNNRINKLKELGLHGDYSEDELPNNILDLIYDKENKYNSNLSTNFQKNNEQNKSILGSLSIKKYMESLISSMKSEEEFFYCDNSDDDYNDNDNIDDIIMVFCMFFEYWYIFKI